MICDGPSDSASCASSRSNPPGIPSIGVSPMIPITVSSKAGVVLLRSALTPYDILLPFFVSDMYVVHFFRISSTLLICPVELQEFTLAHMDSQTRFGTVCCRG